MEIRTTNPELEELIRILAANNAETTLHGFASRCAVLLPDCDISHSSLVEWVNAIYHPEVRYYETRPATQSSTEHFVRTVGVNKCHDPNAAAYLCFSSASLPSAKQAALQSAYWAREYIILMGIRKKKTLEEINDMVRRFCTLQVRYMWMKIKENNVTHLLPADLQDPFKLIKDDRQ